MLRPVWPPKRRPPPKRPPSKPGAAAMRLTAAAALAFTLPLALAACGESGASAPGAVSPGEAKALDEAAAMLDERRLPPEALPTGAQLGDAPGDAASAAPARD